VTFQPGAPSGIVDQNAYSYQRAAYAGVAPNFLSADWTTGTPSR
jgi:hypothetical protein